MKGFLTAVLALFTRNWGLKLLALTLAVVIYHSLKQTNGNLSKSNDRSIFQSR